MPFARPSLADLRTQVAQDVAAALPGADPLLRFSNLGILAAIQAGLAHLHYGYLDWIAQQSNPFTASGEFLEAWAALKGVIRVPAAQASGTITFTGANGTVLSSGVVVVRGDGKTYTTTTGGTVSGGVVTVSAAADADPGGLLGAFGNCSSGTVLSLAVAVAGIATAGAAATAFTGGADLETDDSLRERMLLAYQAPAHGGNAADYVVWAREVAGVTRAWCVPHGYGPGTVLVYVMLDVTESAYGGFPQGANGCATGENRDTAATGDQLAVANHVFPLQPVTALVYVQAPSANTVNFTISGLAGAGTTVQNNVKAAIAAVFADHGAVAAGATTVHLSLVEAAIVAVPGTSGFVITTPGGDIVSAAGALPVLGTVTWT